MHRGFWYIGEFNVKNVAIKEHHLYNKAFKLGKKYVGKYVAVYVLRDYSAKKFKNAHPQKLFVNRLGLSVSKKLGGAVERNRAKRVCRAAYDTVKERLKTGNLIVISPRISILSTKSTAVSTELETAFEALDMLVPVQEQTK